MTPTQTIGIIYCGVSLLSALILIMSAVTITKITSRHTIMRYVYHSYVFAGLAAVFDCTYALREIVGVVFPAVWSYVLTIAYVTCINLTGTFWIFYAEKKQNSWVSKTKKRLILFTLPLFAFNIFIFTTPWTRAYFYFENNAYYRGPLFIVTSLLLLVYVVQNGAKSLFRSFLKRNYVERHELRRLFMYAFTYLVIQLIQLNLPNVFPFRSVGTMLVLGIFLVRKMQETIGADALTRINNRYAVDRYLGSLMDQNHDFEIVLLDADKFKNINDKYGHVEGDKALTVIAEAIKEAMPRNCFIARWGGDEFIILNHDKNQSIADAEEKINQSLAEAVKRNNCAYQITVTAGFFVKNDSVNSIPDLLQNADADLYARKSTKNKK